MATADTKDIQLKFEERNPVEKNQVEQNNQFDQKLFKFYQLWSTGNKIFFKGNIFSGSENPKFWISFFMTNLPLIINYIFTVPYLSHKNEIAGIFFLCFFHISCNVFMFLVNLSDPGIIPKIVQCGDLQDVHIVLAVTIVLKDLTITVLGLELVLAKETTIAKEYPISLVLIIYTFLVIFLDTYQPFLINLNIITKFSIFIIGLFCFHNVLVFKNATTNEYIKKNWNIISKNPFSRVHVPSLINLKHDLYLNAKFNELDDDNEQENSIIDALKNNGSKKKKGDDFKFGNSNCENTEIRVRNSSTSNSQKKSSNNLNNSQNNGQQINLQQQQSQQLQLNNISSNRHNIMSNETILTKQERLEKQQQTLNLENYTNQIKEMSNITINPIPFYKEKYELINTKGNLQSIQMSQNDQQMTQTLGEQIKSQNIYQNNMVGDINKDNQFTLNENQKKYHKLDTGTNKQIIILDEDSEENQNMYQNNDRNVSNSSRYQKNNQNTEEKNHFDEKIIINNFDLIVSRNYNFLRAQEISHTSSDQYNQSINRKQLAN